MHVSLPINPSPPVANIVFKKIFNNPNFNLMHFNQQQIGVILREA